MNRLTLIAEAVAVLVICIGIMAAYVVVTETILPGTWSCFPAYCVPPDDR